MARKAMIIKAQKKPKYSTRKVNRCFKCGRRHGYMRNFGLCRICFRELALEGSASGGQARLLDQFAVGVENDDVGVLVSQIKSNEKHAILEHGRFLLLHL